MYRRRETAKSVIADGRCRLQKVVLFQAVKHEAGEAGPPEILQLAELLEQTGEIEEARCVARALHREHPDNGTVSGLCKRLEA